MMHGMHSFGVGISEFGPILWLLVLGFLIWGIIKFVNNNHNNRYNIRRDEKPLDKLKRRYARGEISKEQYNTMKREIN